MPQLDLSKYKVRAPEKRQFEGQDVYILPNLNAAAGIAKNKDMTALDPESEVFSIEYAATFVKHHVVTKKGVPVFSNSVSEIAENYDAGFIDGLYDLVIEVSGSPSQKVGDAEKKS